MRNKYGIIPIKIRAKNPEDIHLNDLTTITSESVIIDGNLKDAVGNKLIFLDCAISDDTNNLLTFEGITSLISDSYISVICYNESTGVCNRLYLSTVGFLEVGAAI